MDERRDIEPKGFKLRAADSGSVIEGYAAVFDQPTIIWDFEETIAPKAFSRSIVGGDTRSLFNHDANFILGRTTNGTLTLREDTTGLWTETIPPKTPIAESIVESIRRGDISGMSFAFTVRRQEWVFSEDPETLDRRVITEIGTLYDVGPVTYPAYEQTSVKVRAAMSQLHKDARARWEEKRGATVSVSVPKEAELIFRECRSGDSWELDTIETPQKEAESNEEPTGDVKETPQGSGEKTTETPSESTEGQTGTEGVSGVEGSKTDDGAQAGDAVSKYSVRNARHKINLMRIAAVTTH